MDEDYKDLVFRTSSRRDLLKMPEEARKDIGYALWMAQTGRKHASGKPLTGRPEFKGSKVLEIVAEVSPNTYRGVYTIEFEEAVYALDAFVKKSKAGISTPKQDIDRIVGRIKDLRKYRATPEGKAEIDELLRARAGRRRKLEARKAVSHATPARPKGS